MSEINWDEVLEELNKLKESLSSENTSEKPSNNTASAMQQEDYDQPEQEGSHELDYWLMVGRQSFITRYGQMPNFSKYLPIIESRAVAKLQADMQAGKVKDSYDVYLENALKEVLKEFSSISQDFYLLARYANNTTNAPKQVQKPYTQEDYYNDYKKMLEKITLKDVAHIRYEDGSQHSGYWGQPKLELGAIPRLDDV